jgi:hypothetical protein
MTEFSPRRDELIDRPCLSYQAQFRLPKNARRRLADIATRLAESAPSGIWPAPEGSLHVTCYSLISPRDDSYDKDRYWRGMSSLATEAVRRVSQEVPAYALRFSALRVTDRAIVALAEDAPSVAAARAIFTRLVPAPDTEVQQLPRTIHATLCRYGDPAPIPRDLPEIAAAMPLDVCAGIDTLTLVRETIYPSLCIETIVSAPLGGTGAPGDAS